MGLLGTTDFTRKYTAFTRGSLAASGIEPGTSGPKIDDITTRLPTALYSRCSVYMKPSIIIRAGSICLVIFHSRGFIVYYVTLISLSLISNHWYKKKGKYFIEIINNVVTTLLFTSLFLLMLLLCRFNIPAIYSLCGS